MRSQFGLLLICSASLVNGHLWGEYPHEHSDPSATTSNRPDGVVAAHHASAEAATAHHGNAAAPPHENDRATQHADNSIYHSGPLPLRPLHVDELSVLPVQDFHKVNHEVHLAHMNKEHLDELAQPLLGWSQQLLHDQHSAQAAIMMHGGHPDKFGSGSQDARQHHMNLATARMSLNEIVAPLEAVKQQASNIGHYELHDTIHTHLAQIPKLPKPEEETDHSIGRKLYRHIVGQPTRLIRKIER